MRTATIFAIIMLAASPVSANWRLYWEDSHITASFDYLSRASCQDRPCIWARWHYVNPDQGIGGVKIRFAADCATHRLYEIQSDPYDSEGNYLGLIRREDAPKEYPVTPGSLNEATYKLMCR